jgi:3-deoxy-manno-octulosonate cytidylyltransferase (CMP-KDO synthetase)
MGATRFPGKPLQKICGMPMVEHVYRRAQLIDGVTSTYVATCDIEIFQYIESIGGNVVMTSISHERATDRTAEAVQIIEKNTGQKIDVVIMIQGDEPLLDPRMFDSMLPYFLDNNIKVVNLMSKLKTQEEFMDANEVKVVCDKNNNALYFSREPIPSKSKWNGNVTKFKQLGIISFTKDYLLKFYKMPQSLLEKIESIDMLRVLENGEDIKMLETDVVTIGVDTPGELSRVEKIMQNDSLFMTYK